MANRTHHDVLFAPLAPAQHQRVEQRAQPVGVAGERLVRGERLSVLWQPQEAEEGEEVVGRVLDGRAGQAPGGDMGRCEGDVGEM